MREKNENRNMYEIVYSKQKRLRDDNRLKYYSFLNIIQYREVIHLGIFSILYITSAGLNIQLSHPFNNYEERVNWPFERYAEGAFCGLFCIILFSDCIFQDRMLFAPVFLTVTISLLYHIIAFIIFIYTNTF